MIITISGKPGSGKSTVAKLLAKKLGWKRFSAGDARGEAAQKLGITIDEFNTRANKDYSLHKFADEMTIQLSKQGNCVMDGWIAWFFLPTSFKVFLDVSSNVAARRIFQEQHRAKRPDELVYKTIAQAQRTLRKRMNISRAQFISIYGKRVDFLNLKNYDLVLNTSKSTPEKTCKEILKKMKRVR